MHVITSNSALIKWKRNIEKLRPVFLSGKLTILMKVPIKLTTRDLINIQVLAMFIELSLTTSPILLNRVTVSSTMPIQVVSAEKRTWEIRSILLPRKSLKPKESRALCAWIMVSQTVPVGKLLNSTLLFSQSLDLKVVRPPRDSTWNSQSIDQEHMVLQTSKIIFNQNGKSKSLHIWEKLIICWIQDLEVVVSRID